MPRFMFKEVFRYAAMPEIMPRLRSLLFGGFGYIPFFIAVVYQMVGLLPKNHPYIMQKNIGRYGLRHVLAETANNITFSIKHIDQIVLYVAVLAGIIMFFIQFLALGSIFVLQPAFALPSDWGGFFVISNAGYRAQDFSNMMLDMVFGVPHPSLANTGFFESCVSTSVSCLHSDGSNITAIDTSLLPSFTPQMAAQMSPLTDGAYTYFPFAFHSGLHKIFAVYSHGLLVIAMMMTLYFVVTILGETAQTGTPFGKRFNKTWAPIRIVMAFGLLVPLTVGLNSSQYIVLYAAKYGSAFASNGWRYFNDTLSTNYIGEHQSMVSMPNAPDLNDLAQFMFVARTCKYVTDYYIRMEKKHKAGKAAKGKTTLNDDEAVQAYVLLEDNAKPNYLMVKKGTSYADVINATPVNTVKIKIRFGVRDETKYSKSHSSVKAVCGDIILPLIDGQEYDKQEKYIRTVQTVYYDLVHQAWFDTLWNGVAGGAGFPAYSSSQNHRYRYIGNLGVKGLEYDVDHKADLDAVYVQNINNKAKTLVVTATAAALKEAQVSTLWGDKKVANADWLYSRGWAGAGIWYNRIAQINGQLTAAVFGVPQIIAYPAIMETVADKKAMYSKVLFVTARYKPEAPAIDDLGLLLDQGKGREYAETLHMAYEKWIKAANVQAQHPRGNPILTYISFLLGVDGLYNMRENAANSTHPLAQLSGVGKSLVESAIRSLGFAAGVTLFGAIGPVNKQLMTVISSFLITIAMLSLTIGFVLFYILPFLPFIYFFFAVGGWIKGLFEAMIGAPLWALAHIRIDGEGLPGNAAMNGYFLIFEGFLRPILIVFGMLASISIFAALVNVLNSIFNLIAQNAGGYDMKSQLMDASFSGEYMRSLIDQFFFTVIYTIIVYMIGMSCFKLIDQIPNNILRWMGQAVSSFGDQREDPAQGLTSRASIGSQQVLGKLGGGLQGLSSSAIGK